MVDKANLPRQDSVIAETGKPSREWYNFFRRLVTQVNELQDNPPSTGSTAPPFLSGGNCTEITVQDATTARTLTADDDKVNVEFTNASAITVTVNADVLPENSITYLTQGAAGQVTVVAGAGVTIDYSDTLKTRTQESMIGLKQIQANKFELFGDAEPLALARSALIRAANTNGAPAWVAPTADSQKLKRVSGALAWATDTASEIVNVPAGNIAATNVQTALNELDTEKAAASHTHTASNITDFSAAADARIAAASINALADVVITAPSATQVLKYNGTNWINDTDATGGGGGDLDSLTDVVLTAPSTGQVLKYNGTNWINDTDATGGGGGGLTLAQAMTVSSLRI